MLNSKATPLVSVCFLTPGATGSMGCILSQKNVIVVFRVATPSARFRMSASAPHA